jgi:ABC-type maltose transport system permease subunit
MKEFLKNLAKATAITVGLFGVAVGLAYLKEWSRFACLAVVFIMILAVMYYVVKNYTV